MTVGTSATCINFGATPVAALNGFARNQNIFIEVDGDAIAREKFASMYNPARYELELVNIAQTKLRRQLHGNEWAAAQ